MPNSDATLQDRALNAVLRFDHAVPDQVTMEMSPQTTSMVMRTIIGLVMSGEVDVDRAQSNDYMLSLPVSTKLKLASLYDKAYGTLENVKNYQVYWPSDAATQEIGDYLAQSGFSTCAEIARAAQADLAVPMVKAPRKPRKPSAPKP